MKYRALALVSAWITSACGGGNSTDEVLPVPAVIGTAAKVQRPGPIALARDGSLYVADQSERILRLKPDGNRENIAVPDVVHIESLAVAPDGAIYLTDGVGRVRRVDPGGTAHILQTPGLDRPRSIAIASDGTLYIADFERVLQLRAGQPPSTVFTATTLRGIAVDLDGSLLAIAGHQVFRIVPGSADAALVAGTGQAGFNGDELTATEGRLHHPSYLTVGPDGSIYISDYHNHRIRRIFDGRITTYAGTGERGYSGDLGASTEARISLPMGLAIDPRTGILYFADSGNSVIRRVTPLAH